MTSKNPILIKRYRKTFYDKHKQQIINEVHARRLKIRKWYDEYKTNSKCIKCQENHIACLDFHHRDKNKKTFTISKGVAEGYSIKRILKEIEKCDILCANCHRKEHYSLKEKINVCR